MSSSPTACSRQPGSVYTGCRCPDCRLASARLAKLIRNGRRPEDVRDAAVIRLRGWIEAGYSDGAIASMTGLSSRSVAPLVKSLRDGGSGLRMRHQTARAVLAATEPTSGFVPSVGATRRLRALSALGWDLASLAQWTTVPVGTLGYIREGDRSARARAGAVSAIVALYDRLSMTPGPSTRAAALARHKGWPPPLAWDDGEIDNPEAVPDTGSEPGRRIDVDELRERIRLGTTDRIMADHFGVSPDSLYVALRRHGHHSDSDRLLRWSGKDSQPRLQRGA